MIQTLDCLAIDPPSERALEILAQLPHLRKLRIRVKDIEGDGMLAIVARLTGLTCLHFYSAHVRLPFQRMLSSVASKACNCRHKDYCRDQ